MSNAVAGLYANDNAMTIVILIIIRNSNSGAHVLPEELDQVRMHS